MTHEHRSYKQSLIIPLSRFLLFFSALSFFTACGVKGPPLPPEDYRSSDENAIYTPPKIIPLNQATQVSPDGTTMEYEVGSAPQTQPQKNKKKTKSQR